MKTYIPIHDSCCVRVFMIETLCVYCQVCTEAEEKLGISTYVSMMCRLLFP